MLLVNIMQEDAAQLVLTDDMGCRRLVVLAAADALDKVGNKAARQQITAAKVYVPNVVLRILDAAIQVSGAATCNPDSEALM